VTARATEQPVVSREKHVDGATLRTSQVQRIKCVKAKLLKFPCPIGILSPGANHFAGESEHRIHIVAAFLIWIPGNLHLDNGAAYPDRTITLYHSQNLLDGPGFLAHPRLALVIRQSV
jgi:hypothetical protein